VSQLVVFLALAFSIVIAIFAVQNTTPVTVQFLGFRVDGVAVSVLVLISAALGAAAILLLGIAREVQWRWRQRSLNQQLRQARQPQAPTEPTETTETKAIAPPEPAASIGGPTATDTRASSSSTEGTPSGG
jgi:lipopolysaccharide assembly protein A